MNTMTTALYYAQNPAVIAQTVVMGLAVACIGAIALHCLINWMMIR